MRSEQARTVALAVGGSFVVAALLFLANGENPFDAFRLLYEGSIGSSSKLSNTLIVWVPLALAAASLIVTFAAGLWNIGVEGQIIAGAIAAAWAAREIPGPSFVVITAAIVAGIIGGALWGLLAGVLKVYGGVNEIFGGLGLFFVATGGATYLIIGPWKRAGIASTSGTDLFREEAWLPTIGSLSISWVSILLAVFASVGVYLLMRGSSFGLKLKAIGNNLRSAARLGIPSNRFMLLAFGLGGGIAGIAGAVQVLGFHHKLIPSISGGFGFLGILIVLLAGFRAWLTPPIAFFFAAISVGTTFLELRLGLDASLGGVLQGLLVLFVILAGGWQRKRRAEAAAAAPIAAVAAEAEA
ncbi:MAG: ABC transporter permease [Acidimicrobiia bacterium]